MCEHNHNHSHHHKHDNVVLFRVGAAIAALIISIFISQGELKTIILIAAYLISGADIILKAAKNIIKGEVFDENFLMSIATIGAVAIGEYPEAAMVMVLYQLGEFLQHSAVEKSRRSISKLMDIRPDYAYVEENSILVKKDPKDISVGTVITVKSGEKIPLDGIVTEGSASVDTSALTGESAPRKLKVQDDALSGTINIDGLLKIRTTKEFGESTVSKILQLVEHAGTKKAKSENFITKFARYYTPIVVVGAILLALLPPLLIEGAQFNVWLERALTFLVISCPCALVISVPLGFFAGIGGASKCGILIKGSSYIEALSKANTVVFDKTGTLTKGSFRVSTIKGFNGANNEELLRYAATGEFYSNHPIALSIKEAYRKEINPSQIINIEEIAGKGIVTKTDTGTIFTGNEKLMQQFGIKYSKADTNGTVVYLAYDSKYLGYIIISDEIKPDSINAIEKLKQLVKRIVILSGDSVSAVKQCAEILKIKETFSHLLPNEKVEKIENIIENNQKGKTVIFAGDGINDAPVLTRADVGIAMGALGSDAAIEAADVVIMDDKPSKIVTAIKSARKTMRIVRQNIVFAIGIKVLFLILGALGIITMWGAVFADVGVSVIAILNSLRALRAC